MMGTSDHTEVPDAGQLAELQALVDQATTQAAQAAPPPNVTVTHVTPPAKTKNRAVNRDKPELPAYILAMIALICIAVLTFHGNAVPDVMNLVAVGALGIGGAVTQTPKPPVA